MLLLNGAADEARTRYLHLGKVALYQMSYGRMMESLALSALSGRRVLFYRIYLEMSTLFSVFFEVFLRFEKSVESTSLFV